MNIVLFSNEEIDKPLSLRDERVKHIRGVLHKAIGDSFDAGIINGKSGIAKITQIDQTGFYFNFTPQKDEPELFNIQLIVGFPRPIQLKRLLRDVSSLGVCEVHLTATELGEKSYRNSTLLERGAAMQGLIDGATQAKTTKVPNLFMHNSLKECLKSLGLTEKNENAHILSEFKTFPQEKHKNVENFTQNPQLFHKEELLNFQNQLNESETIPILLDNVKPICNLSDFAAKRSFKGKKIIASIGSERGWTEREREMFYNFGFLPCSLGRRILRTETACTSAITLLLASMNEL